MTKQEFAEKYGFNSSVGAFGIGTKDCRKELLIDLDNVIKALTLNGVGVRSELYTYDCKVCGKPFDKKEDYYHHYDTEHN